MPLCYACHTNNMHNIDTVTRTLYVSYKPWSTVKFQNQTLFCCTMGRERKDQQRRIIWIRIWFKIIEYRLRYHLVLHLNGHPQINLLVVLHRCSRWVRWRKRIWQLILHVHYILHHHHGIESRSSTSTIHFFFRLREKIHSQRGNNPFLPPLTETIHA